MNDNPIRLIQWQDPNDPDEIVAIEQYLSGVLKEKCPNIDSRTALTLHDFQSGLRSLITPPGTDILYISAHGDKEGISAGGESLSFLELGNLLADHLNGQSGIWLVFGSCEAANIGSELFNSVPPSISTVFGFEGKPTAKEVATFMSYIVSKDQLYIFCEGGLLPQFSALESKPCMWVREWVKMSSLP